jgi:predicted cupin superfamily sugar epimerase
MRSRWYGITRRSAAQARDRGRHERAVDRVTLGPDLTGGQRPQAIVLTFAGGASRRLTLVARWPGFEFEVPEPAP